MCVCVLDPLTSVCLHLSLQAADHCRPHLQMSFVAAWPGAAAPAGRPSPAAGRAKARRQEAVRAALLEGGGPLSDGLP